MMSPAVTLLVIHGLVTASQICHVTCQIMQRQRLASLFQPSAMILRILQCPEPMPQSSSIHNSRATGEAFQPHQLLH